jgi:hypothetical protein
VVDDRRTTPGHNPKKTVYTLNVDNYAPEITAITYPLLRHWASKIGADFHVIDTRKFPDWPPVYEKLQIYELGQAHGNDWNIFVDSDALVHPDFFDPTEFVGKGTVLHNGSDMANNRWKYDRFFRRDGRHIGSCNWFTIASDWCIELWKPLDDLTLEEAVANIYPTMLELSSGVIAPSHLIDDYTLSRNIAKHGFHFERIIDMEKRIGGGGNYLHHEYLIPVEAKVKKLKEVLVKWELLSPENGQEPNEVTQQCHQSSSQLQERGTLTALQV